MTQANITDREGVGGIVYTGVDDTYTRSFGPTSNFGGGETMLLRCHTADMDFGFIRFTGLSNITGPVAVSAATLSIYADQGPAGTGRSLILRRCLRNWVELELTHNIYSTAGGNWQTPGGLGALDRDSTTLGSIALDDRSGAEYAITLNAAGLAVVEGWINGTFPNNGFHLGFDDESGVGDFEPWGIWSSDATFSITEQWRPMLTVDYSPAPAGAVFVPSSSMKIWV